MIRRIKSGKKNGAKPAENIKHIQSLQQTNHMKKGPSSTKESCRNKRCCPLSVKLLKSNEFSKFVENKTRISGEFDSRKTQPTKLDRRPQILTKKIRFTYIR